MNTNALRFCAVIANLLFATSVLAAPELAITPQNDTGVYQPSDLAWKISVHGAGAEAIKEASYSIKRGGATPAGQGTVFFNNGSAVLTASLKEPGALLAEITAKTAEGKELKALGGAVVSSEKIKPSAPCPADFDAFWKTKLGELAAVPPHPVLAPAASGKNGVEYWQLTMDNIRGTKIRGHLARPTQGQKFPAILFVQYAGVYPLPKNSAVGAAVEGWLALNISAHDLPLEEPQAFYDQQNNGPLKNYTAIGNDDREKSYFLRMFLACHRAVEYLAQRPDWNGKTLVVSGTSQGGLQAFVTAGLNHKVTALLAMVPAGCDNTGALAGRRPGWPYWMSSAVGKDQQKALETSKYFDGVNFAARVKCPALVGIGLIDTTSPPEGVWSAVNLMQGSKEVVALPLSDHRGRNNSQAPYHVREKVWRAALVHDQPPPVK
ncbi:MAG: acetylxylan esterase [Kiritimatiellaeota bacterium]|nr:acetylxylan esterase [Kiritimatiellota bacterium]